jgi:hypothetical protein
MLRHIRNTANGLLTLYVVSLTLSACAAAKGHPPPVRESSPQSSLIGMTQDAVRSCAGSPLNELKLNDDAAVLRYYKEAAMLDESQVGSKGSISGVHRGCWAGLLVEKGNVTGVEFRPVPDQERDPFLCHQIFEGCSR